MPFTVELHGPARLTAVVGGVDTVVEVGAVVDGSALVVAVGPTVVVGVEESRVVAAAALPAAGVLAGGSAPGVRVSTVVDGGVTGAATTSANPTVLTPLRPVRGWPP